MEPKIRFKGFSGEWKKPTINEIFEIRNGYTPSKAVKEFWEGGTIPWFRMEDIRENGGILKDSFQHITPLGIKNTGLFEKDSIILATTATIGVHAILIADSLANQQFTNFSIRKSLKKDYNNMFVYYSFFGIDEWSKKNTNSGGLLSVNVPFLLKEHFHTPSLEEQIAIAEYFQHLDTLIQSTEKKIESLKRVKAASLQSMFPQEGETKPRVRFKGFEGDWEMDIIGNIASFSKGRGYSKSDLKTEGNPIILYGSLYTNYSSRINSVNTFASLKSGSIVSKGNEVIIPGSGETPEDIAIASSVEQKGVILGGDLNIVTFNPTKILPAFAAICISNSKTHYELSCYAQGKTVVHLHNSSISKVHLSYPSKDEQTAIAQYFSNLDKQISLQTQRLEKLKQIKSACLDNMFV